MLELLPLGLEQNLEFSIKVVRVRVVTTFQAFSLATTGYVLDPGRRKITAIWPLSALRSDLFGWVSTRGRTQQFEHGFFFVCSATI